MAITFQSQLSAFNLKHKQALRKWLSALVTGEKKIPGDINFLFTSDEELLEINIKYLNHNTYTDIITFDSSFGNTVAGDIMISVDRVRDNAAKFKVDTAEELHRVMAHGVMHLCGYKDKTKVQSTFMRKKEDTALKKLKSFIS